MTVVGVTGTRRPIDGFTSAEEHAMRTLVNELGPDTLVVTGGCYGVDAFVTVLAAQRGLPTRAYLATDTRQTDFRALRQAGTELVHTGKGLLARNDDLVAVADQMHAFGLHLPRQQPRSGSWACARKAQRRGKLHSVVVFRRSGHTAKPTMHDRAELYCLCQRECACPRRAL